MDDKSREQFKFECVRYDKYGKVKSRITHNFAGDLVLGDAEDTDETLLGHFKDFAASLSYHPHSISRIEYLDKEDDELFASVSGSKLAVSKIMELLQTSPDQLVLYLVDTDRDVRAIAEEIGKIRELDTE